MKKTKLIIPLLLFIMIGVGIYGEDIASSPWAGGSFSGEITLEDALQAALASEPVLAAFAFEVERNRALEEQAGKLPNPELKTVQKDFAGSGPFSGSQAMKSLYGISQKFKLGGKRGKRVRAALQKTAVSEAELDGHKREVETMVKARFAAVLSSQQALQIQKENLELVRASFSVISELVSVGEISPLLQDRAAAELAKAETDFLKAEQDLEKHRLDLAATWNSFNPGFTSVEGNFDEIASIPRLEELLKNLDDHPLARRWEAEKRHNQARLELEKSQLWPDIEIGGSYKKIQENMQHAYVIEMSVPLPLFDRNQGAIKAARAEAKIAEKREQFYLLQLKNRAADAYRALTSAKAELDALNSTLVPAAKRAYEAVSEAFRLGEEEYISVIDSQRMLLEATRRQAELSADFFKLKAELEGLTGKPLENFLPPERTNQ